MSWPICIPLKVDYDLNKVGELSQSSLALEYVNNLSWRILSQNMKYEKVQEYEGTEEENIGRRW